MTCALPDKGRAVKGRAGCKTEPALFVINEAGVIQIIDLSNAPFARPDLKSLLERLTFLRDKGYPMAIRSAAQIRRYERFHAGRVLKTD